MPATPQEPAPSDSGQGVSGVLRLDEEPVDGARIEVETPEGNPVDTTTSAGDGAWSVPLVTPGAYVVRLDEATLPDGVVLADSTKGSLTVEVRPGQDRVIIFQLADESGPTTSEEGFDWRRLVSLSVDGVRLGIVLGVMAMGLSLIFGVTRLINFAHGELVTFGAIAAWVFNAGAFRFPLFLAGIVGLLLSAALGWGLERGLFRPLRRRRTSTVALIVVTIGLSEFLRSFYQLTFGPLPEPYRDYALQREIDLGPLTVTPKSLGIICIGAVAIVLVAFLLQRTRLGTAMRAVADNKDLAASSGIDVQRVILHVWILGAVLAGLGGILLGVTQKVEFDMGFKALLLIFAAVVVGGLGTAYGPVLGALLLGVVIQVSTIWFDTEFKFVFALLALILMLVFRPQGILGRRERVG
ncbi:MAG: branched-chain amino acid ABC transporter permease [Acidimicrobiia bacterium]|nr:branched-chain amino acid ABC transporter permease [Acidimicrobiia bacterium]